MQPVDEHHGSTDGSTEDPIKRKNCCTTRPPPPAPGCITNASAKAVGGPAPCGPMASGPEPPTRSRPPMCSSTHPSCTKARPAQVEGPSLDLCTQLQARPPYDAVPRHDKAFQQSRNG